MSSEQILWMSSSADGVPIAYRLQVMGYDVSVYTHNPAFRPCYEGMIKNRVETALDLRKWTKRADKETAVIIFDMLRPNEGSAEDEALARIRSGDHKGERVDTCFGALADYWRKLGYRVIGASRFTERLELDRYYGKEIAKSIGMQVPGYTTCSTVDRAIDFLGTEEGKRKRWVLKPDGNQHLDCTYIEHYEGELLEKLQGAWASRLEGRPMLLEEYIDGVTLDEEVWWDGTRFLYLNCTLERKRFLAGDRGQHVGSMLNLVWMKRKPFVPWGQLEESLKKSGYLGPINATVQVGTGGCNFLEWTPRFGYDAIFGLLEIHRKRQDFLLLMKQQVGQSTQFAATSRLSIPPYPYEDKELLKQLAEGVPVHVDYKEGVWPIDVLEGLDGMQCAGADGDIAVVVGTEDTAQGAIQRLKRNIGGVRIGADVQCRDDLDALSEDWRRLSNVLTR